MYYLCELQPIFLELQDSLDFLLYKRVGKDQFTILRLFQSSCFERFLFVTIELLTLIRRVNTLGFIAFTFIAVRIWPFSTRLISNSRFT